MTIFRSDKEFLHSFEHFNALSSPKHHWLSTHSGQEGRCFFGCAIPEEEVFFKKPLDTEAEECLCVCWDCMQRMVFLTVDSDHHSRELTRHLKQEQQHHTRHRHIHFSSHL